MARALDGRSTGDGLRPNWFSVFKSETLRIWPIFAAQSHRDKPYSDIRRNCPDESNRAASRKA